MEGREGRNVDGGSRPNRRTFLSMAGAAAAMPAILAACGGTSNSGSGGSGASTTPLKFWNQPWGTTAFNTLDKQITLAYHPKHGLPRATYQVIPWANFLQTYTSAVSSNTGPAVSSGGGTQAFLFSHQGFIHYADNLVNTWSHNGLKDDFLPGLLGTMHTKQGYAAVPYNLDMRPWWYNETIFNQLGITPPTDWQSYLNACATLKSHNIYGFGIGEGAGNFIGSHVITSFMINNGGGIFDHDQQPHLVTNANIEAVNFVLELVSKGYADPASVSYTNANVYAQWTAGKFAMGFDTAGAATNVGGTVGQAMKVGDPLVGPSGKKGAIYFPNNIMMYKHTPSVPGSEAFMTYYYQHMKPLWTENTGIGLPPLKSITETPQFKADANNVKVIKDWQPISHTWAWPGSDSLFYGVTTVDGTPAMNTFAQSILSGRTDAKTALTTLENAIKSQPPYSGG